jgi:hypothetical protein
MGGRIAVHISICPDFGFGIFYYNDLSAETGSRQDWPGVWIFLWFRAWTWRYGRSAARQLADVTNINFVYRTWSFLPAVGLLPAFLPNLSPSLTAATC